MSTVPAPDASHQNSAGNLYYHLRRYLETNHVGFVYTVPVNVELDDLIVYQPDIVFVSHNRSLLTDHGLSSAPNLLIEFLSPKTARFDLGLKRQTYFRTGVEELWIVDPQKRTISVYRQGGNEESPVATLRSGEVLMSSVLPRFQMEVSTVFSEL